MAPVSPFYADRLYTDLITATGRDNVVSVHLAEFPKYQEEMIDKELEAISLATVSRQVYNV